MRILTRTGRPSAGSVGLQRRPPRPAVPVVATEAEARVLARPGWGRDR
ncbi:hypothetical protein [Pararhodospirillum photometricum]|nr:hypothetical protein [Pararhodospirillum photometricum]